MNAKANNPLGNAGPAPKTGKWKYYIHDGSNKLVASQCGYDSDDLAKAAGGEHAKKLASARKSIAMPPVYTVTTGQE